RPAAREARDRRRLGGPLGPDPPDVGRPAPALRQAVGSPRTYFPPALADRWRARAPAAGVQHPSGGLGQSARDRPPGGGGVDLKARSRGVAGSPRGPPAAPERSPSAPRPAPRPARDRRDRPVVGRRDPVERASVAVQAGIGSHGRRGGRPAGVDARDARRRARPLRASGRAADPRQAADAAGRPPPSGGTVPALRRAAGGS